MLKHITLLNTLLAALVLQTLPLSAAEGHYRWKDETGKLHYSDRPPTGVEAEFVEIATGRSSRPTPTSEPVKPPTPENSNQAEETAQQPVEQTPGKDPTLCAQAKANAAALSKPKVRITDADGTKRILAGPEKEAEIERAQKFIDIYCE